ncbi:hypothetical protein BDZ97DRAFT_1919655 [Flammula alnicola]|nr:hypothetical protein BDZ97DRAFT_1919655 [Flammula alnicola]
MTITLVLCTLSCVLALATPAPIDPASPSGIQKAESNVLYAKEYVNYTTSSTIPSSASISLSTSTATSGVSESFTMNSWLTGLLTAGAALATLL